MCNLLIHPIYLFNTLYCKFRLVQYYIILFSQIQSQLMEACTMIISIMYISNFLCYNDLYCCINPTNAPKLYKLHSTIYQNVICHICETSYVKDTVHHFVSNISRDIMNLIHCMWTGIAFSIAYNWRPVTWIILGNLIPLYL